MDRAAAFADRCALRVLRRVHPDWSIRQLATAMGRSLAFVVTWLRRTKDADPADVVVLQDRSHTPPPRATFAPLVIDRLLTYRDTPPQNLGRVPGPKALHYYLSTDPALQGERIPSPTSIWRLLHIHGRIATPEPFERQPVERPAPLTVWQQDFKDAGVPITDPDGKKQHVVEVLNTLDVGTSILVDAHARSDFQAATVIETLAQLVQTHGLPQEVQFDRDSRFVGSIDGRDFPAAVVRFWQCLGVTVTIWPPYHPEKNGFVERYNGTYKYECLRRQRPATLEDVKTITAAFKEHYNRERPNQAVTCQNRPPLVAFPQLPARPAPPLVVDPDGWLRGWDGHAVSRTVRKSGSVRLHTDQYYIGTAFAGQRVTMVLVAATREVVVYQGQHEVKRVPLKGLVGTPLAFADFVTHLVAVARHERRWNWTNGHVRDPMK